MAQPAKKLSPPASPASRRSGPSLGGPGEAEIELTLTKKPAEKKDNIVDFNQYRRDLNRTKSADKKEQGAEAPEEENKFEKAQKERDERKKTGAANLDGLSKADASKLKGGISPADKKLVSDLANITGREAPLSEEQKKQRFAKASPEAQQLMREKGMAPESPEQQKAEQAKQGAEMEGVSESAGLTGGLKGEDEGTKPSAAAEQQKTPTSAGGQPDRSGQTPAPSGEENEVGEGGEEEPQKPQSTFQQSQQKIDEQKKRVSGSQDKAAKAKEKYEKDKEQKSWKRALSGRRAKKAQKEAAKEKKQLARLEKVLGTQMASGGALKFAWMNLIDTFGASYIYIAFHFLATYFTPFSNFFCKFGEEWLPKQAKTAGGEAAKKASKGLELVESCACVLIGLLLFFAIMGLLVLFATLGYAYMHKLETLKILGPGVAWEAIKCFTGWVFGIGTCGK